MRAWLIIFWDSLRSSFWFIPAVMTAGILLLAFLLRWVDSIIRIEQWPSMQWFVTTGPAARATLSALASALITLAGLVFSVTMVTLSLTSSQFGSRLLRTFMRHNASQFTLALFLSTSLYCLLVLRSVRQVDGTLFVPHLSVGMAVILTIISLAAFIYFIQHVADSIQAQNVVRSVAHDLDRAIQRIFPELLGDEDEEQAGRAADSEMELAFSAPPENVAVVPAEAEGYLQGIDDVHLLRTAEKYDLLLKLECRPGDFVIRGAPLLKCFPKVNCTEEAVAQLQDAYITGARRTPHQDVNCAVNELVEMAVRALSPGINDPFTALACLDYLGASLCRLAGRKQPSSFRLDDDGRLRVIAHARSFISVLDASFNQIRQYGAESVAVMLRMLESLAAVAAVVRCPEDAAAVRIHAEMVRQSAERRWSEKRDLAEVHSRLDKIHESLSRFQ